MLALGGDLHGAGRPGVFSRQTSTDGRREGCLDGGLRVSLRENESVSVSPPPPWGFRHGAGACRASAWRIWTARLQPGALRSCAFPHHPLWHCLLACPQSCPLAKESGIRPPSRPLLAAPRDRRGLCGIVQALACAGEAQSCQEPVGKGALAGAVLGDCWLFTGQASVPTDALNCLEPPLVAPLGWATKMLFRGCQ